MRRCTPGFGPPTRQGLTFGLFFFDVDLDGRLDVLGANGHLEEEISKTQQTQRYEQPPQLFWNAGQDAKNELVVVPTENVARRFISRSLDAAPPTGTSMTMVIRTWSSRQATERRRSFAMTRRQDITGSRSARRNHL